MKLEEIRKLIEAATPGLEQQISWWDGFARYGIQDKPILCVDQLNFLKELVTFRTLMPKLLKVAEAAIAFRDFTGPGDRTLALYKALAALESE